MADRTISPVSDIFLIWTAVITSLVVQLMLALVGLGIGIVTLGYAGAEPGTMGWAGFLWWAASGILAAGLGGMAIAALGEGIDDARKTVLALLAWATALLIVAIVAALAAGGASLFATVGGPIPAMLGGLAENGAVAEGARQAIAIAAIGSVVISLLGAAAEVAGARFAPETGVRAAKRA